MSGSTIERPGHFPTVLASFLFFDMSFTLWVLLGALGVYIAENLALGPAEKGLMVAVPILSGALLRVPLGLLADRLRDKKVGVAIMVFLFLPLTFAWQLGHNFPILLVIGLMLGAAGASFAVALPLASRWYPPSRQGLIMGIVALGNSGTVIANLVAPRLADWKDWHSVFGVAMLPLTLYWWPSSSWLRTARVIIQASHRAIPWVHSSRATSGGLAFSIASLSEVSWG